MGHTVYQKSHLAISPPNITSGNGATAVAASRTLGRTGVSTTPGTIDRSPCDRIVIVIVDRDGHGGLPIPFTVDPAAAAIQVTDVHVAGAGRWG